MAGVDTADAASNGQGDSNTLAREAWRRPLDVLMKAAQAARDRKRDFLLFPFAVMAGLVVYRAVDAEPGLVVALCVAAMAASWLVLSLRHGGTGFGPMLAVGLAAGFALLPVHGALFGTRMLSGAVYGTYQARVDTVLDATEDRQRIIISEITPIRGRSPDLRRARLFVRDAPPLTPGDIVSGAMRFAEVPGPPVPGGFDAQFHAYFVGIGAYATATGRLEIVNREDAGLAGLVAGLRRGIGERIDKVLSGRQDAVARALIVGDQSRIADETRDKLAVAGIAHVLAISGLHLSLVAGAAFATLRLMFAASARLAQRVAVKKLAAGAGIVVTLAYLAISGASVSATRASIMLILVFGAALFGRQALTMRNVAFAALFILFTAPAGLFRPGFQLSFAAVAALIGTYEQSRFGSGQPGGAVRRVWRFFAGLMISSLVAGLATAVFAAYHFQQTAPLGLLGNLVALPLLGFLVLPSLMIGVLVMPLGLDAPFLRLGGWGIARILDAAAVVAEASDSLSVDPLLSPLVLVFALAAAAWFVFFTGRVRLVGPLVAAALIAFFGFMPVPDVLVADRTLAVGLRDGAQLMLATGRANSFATNVWSETYGLEVHRGGEDIACDSIGCFGTLPDGARVAVATDIAAFIEDCDRSDLVVTRRAAPEWCRRLTEVIDAGDLARGGVAAAYWTPDTRRFDIVFSITDRDRPWRIRR